MGELAWNKLINGLFFRLTSVSDLEVDELISKNPSLSVEQAENLSNSKATRLAKQ